MILTCATTTYHCHDRKGCWPRKAFFLPRQDVGRYNDSWQDLRNRRRKLKTALFEMDMNYHNPHSAQHLCSIDYQEKNVYHLIKA